MWTVLWPTVAAWLRAVEACAPYTLPWGLREAAPCKPTLIASLVLNVYEPEPASTALLLPERLLPRPPIRVGSRMPQRGSRPGLFALSSTPGGSSSSSSSQPASQSLLTLSAALVCRPRQHQWRFVGVSGQAFQALQHSALRVLLDRRVPGVRPWMGWGTFSAWHRLALVRQR